MKTILYLFLLLLSLTTQCVFAKSNMHHSFGQYDNDDIVSIYPNPAKDLLYLKTNNPNIQIKNITFYSILGNTVSEMTINSSYSEIRLDKLRPGKYLMKYHLSNNTQKILQIIKQ